MMERHWSRPECVERQQLRCEEHLCHFNDVNGGKRRHGIVIKVFAARFYDSIRCLIATDKLDGSGTVYMYADLMEVDIY